MKFGKNQAISLMYKYGSKAKNDSINKRFWKIIKHYNFNMNKKPRKPGSGRPKKVKETEINWDIFLEMI
ncbi:hypothetical protein [Mycoplasma seminis]|uniref:Transposase n=1 Tax=Mycoplasma seminis TaxID=512749 RepID=A0ABY9HA53_9MOLU|nr:hypothetical protein [Mycoplasma seminis]WLP85478.1 hypothetical protein Q8852_04125 [Mycoplasma seminis]